MTLSLKPIATSISVAKVPYEQIPQNTHTHTQMATPHPLPPLPPPPTPLLSP
jgi:hypothetical protein